MKINPVWNKELTIGSRSFKLPLGICIYNILLSAIIVVVLFAIQADSSRSGVAYGTLMSMFPILAFLQCMIILLMIPILTASSIAGERERQTLDVMLTTPMSAFSIVLGKVLTAMTQVLMFVLSSIPVMSIAFILGGMSWWNLLGFIVLVIFASFYVGAIGVYCSSKTKKTVTSVILCLILIFVFMVLTLVAFAIALGVSSYAFENAHYAAQVAGQPVNAVYQVGLIPLIVLFNPAVTVGNFVFNAYFGVGIAELGDEYRVNMSAFVYFITQHWTVFSVCVNLLVATGFMRLAAKRINPLKKVKKSKK